jgi:hypothetical protein
MALFVEVCVILFLVVLFPCGRITREERRKVNGKSGVGFDECRNGPDALDVFCEPGISGTRVRKPLVKAPRIVSRCGVRNRGKAHVRAGGIEALAFE